MSLSGSGVRRCPTAARSRARFSCPGRSSHLSCGRRWDGLSPHWGSVISGGDVGRCPCAPEQGLSPEQGRSPCHLTAEPPRGPVAGGVAAHLPLTPGRAAHLPSGGAGRGGAQRWERLAHTGARGPAPAEPP